MLHNGLSKQKLPRFSINHSPHTSGRQSCIRK
ncbi:hypothetical protein ANCCAN_15668 [Ancylostoma caninum]|uniref:Uncharacterized protein n=1 Tax=Ancylostoma caninum TaxID=29170 RepID=A0A368G3Z6_ANCCA|nr:hypothetical protein ANCCAN_15668 [Ancylostoma caninum]